MDRNTLQFVASVLVVAVVIVSYMIGYNVGAAADGGSTSETSAVVGGETFNGMAIKGDPDAPVTIMEWSDFQCPFCGRFYRDTLSQIEAQYIETGKVKLIYRDFPLSFHANAQKAAEAGKCALEQGNEKFWALHNSMMENQAALSVANFKLWAAQAGVDSAKFNECLDSGRMADAVAKDIAEGQAKGVRGTPGFFINGQLVSGAQPFAAFKQVIDQKLAE